MSEDWTKKEVDLIIEDYFSMLHRELNHKNYNKTSHRKSLFPQLNNRSNGSVEFKHQNISAALIKMGLPYIKGYKPRFNYQKETLDKGISDYILNHKFLLEQDFKIFSDSAVINRQIKAKPDFNKIINEEPIISMFHEDEPLYKPVKINYLEKEQNNSILGEGGERLVFEYEKWSLMQAGQTNLADKVKWVSKDLGDGAGYDILSKDIYGQNKYIEVKTTKLSKESPIYLTKNELSFSAHKEGKFYLYRVYNFYSDPKFFIKTGQYKTFCTLQPEIYKGIFI